MFAQLFNLVVGSLCDFLSFAFLARFVMQWARVSFRNPIGNFVVVVTDWAVRPARKVVPGLFGLDLASFLLAWLVQAAYLSLVIGVTGMFAGNLAEAMGSAIFVALLETIRLLVYLGIGVVIVTAIMSWINPYAPLAPFFNQLASPLLRPAQRVIPPIGGLDLSPLLVLLILQALLIVLGHLRASILPFFAS
jgi:YggT family protein